MPSIDEDTDCDKEIKLHKKLCLYVGCENKALDEILEITFEDSAEKLCTYVCALHFKIFSLSHGHLMRAIKENKLKTFKIFTK